MEQLINKITNFANKLDSVLLIDEANTVDNIALSLVKTAQYVGSQGYWIRNQRCWSNCYRNKRAESPSKPTQEVWFDCQSEYEDAINNEGNSWDKYAESDRNTNLSLDIKIAEKLRDSTDVEKELTSYLSEAESVHKNAYLNATEKMLNIAEVLEDKNKALSLEAASIVDALLKEAGWWDNMMGWKDVYNQWRDKHKNPSGTGQFNQTYKDFVNNREQRRQNIKNEKGQLGYQKYDPSQPQQSQVLPQQQVQPQTQPQQQVQPQTQPQQQVQPQKGKLPQMSRSDNQGVMDPASALNKKNAPVQPTQQPQNNVLNIGPQIENILNTLEPEHKQKAMEYITTKVIPYLKDIDNIYNNIEASAKNKEETKGIITNKSNIVSKGMKKVLFKI